MRGHLLFLLLLTASFLSHAATKITFTEQSVEISFPSKVRLFQVLEEANKHSLLSDYPLSFKLFDHSRQNEIDALKKQTLDKIAAYKKAHPEIEDELTRVENGLISLDVGYRVKQPLDIDMVRLSMALNPLIEGDYELQTFDRSRPVDIYGLISASKKRQQHSLDLTVQELLDTVPRRAASNKSHVWVIYPDGVIKKTGFSYWNNEYLTLPPGSALYVGFESPDDEMADIEKNVLLLISSAKG